MNRIAVIFIVIALCYPVFCQEEVILKVSECIDYSKILDENNVFFKWCTDFDIENDKLLYFSDNTIGSIFKVDYGTGKLIQTISSKGQGPHELSWPSSIRVKNSRVYVFDKGFGGVKIFSTEGKFINSFKVNNPGVGDSIDVAANGDIFVQATNSTKKTVLAVYNEKGEMLKELLTFQKVDFSDRSDSFSTSLFKFRLDKSENIYVLLPLQRRIEKYSTQGKFLWASQIKSRFLDKKAKKEPEFSEKAVHFSPSVFDLKILKNNSAIVSYISGCSIFNENGALMKMIITDPPIGLPLIGEINNQIVVVSLFGKLIRVFNVDL